MSSQGLPSRSPERLAPIAAPVAIGILFGCCLKLASSVPTDSDGAAIILQARAVLHGNVLLRGWHLADVSFYTTELPEYIVVAAVRGLRPDVVQICAAITYTLCALLVVLVAKGGATGRERTVRMALSAGLAIVPLATDQQTLLTNPDHTGTAVPVLLLMVMLEKQALRNRMPVITLVVLSAAVIGDQLTLLIGVAPLLSVWLLRSCPGNRKAGRGLERRLAVAACASAVVGWSATQIIKAAGGWRAAATPLSFFAGEGIAKNFLGAVQGLLALFGVRFAMQTSWQMAFAVLQLSALMLVAAAVLVGLRGIKTGNDLIASVLTLAITIDFAAYVLFVPSPLQNYRDIDVIVPLGAALAGRVLAGPLIRMRVGRAIAVLLAGYAITFASGVAQPAQSPANLGLGHWLIEHHLTNGIAGYWVADSLTADTGGTVQVAAVRLEGRKLFPGHWETDTRWFDPREYYANFLVLNPPSGSDPHPVTETEAVDALGAPWRVYSYQRDVIMVWQDNLLEAIR